MKSTSQSAPVMAVTFKFKCILTSSACKDLPEVQVQNSSNDFQGSVEKDLRDKKKKKRDSV